MKSRATEAFREILEGGADVHRCAAARALASVGGPQSVAILTKSLLDEDPDVRTDAAEALCALGDPASAPALMENLIGDPESDVKKAVIRALVAMRYAPVLPVLRKLAVSRSEDIAWDEEEIYADGWDSWVDMQLLAIEGLAAFGDSEGVPAIVAAMSDEMGQDITEQGVAALAMMGAAGAAALAVMLEGAAPRLRRQIARAVATGANPDLSGLQEALLEDALPEVRLITLGGLAADNPGLAPLFADEDAEIRAAVVRMAGDGFSREIAALATDAAPGVRAEVFKRIAAAPQRFKSKEVIEAVKASITDDPAAATQAALALVALRGEKVAKGFFHALNAPNIPLQFRVGVVEALKQAGPVSIPAFLAAAGVPEREVRLAVLTALVGFAADDPIWPNEAGAGLLAALKGELVDAPEEPEEDPEEDAAEKPEALPPLTEEELKEIDDSLPLEMIPLEPEESAPVSTLDSIAAVDPTPVDNTDPESVVLSERDEHMLELSKMPRFGKRQVSLKPTVAPYLDVKRFAARLLGGVVNAEVTENLIAALNDEDAELRLPVVESLVQHGQTTGALPESAAAPLEALLETTAGEVRVMAVRAYGWLADDTVAARLHDLLRDSDPLVRLEAVHALERRGIADEAMFAALDDSYLGVQFAAAKALARLKGADAVDALVAFAFTRDGTNRREIGQLLGRYAPEVGAERLLDTLEDSDLRTSWLVPIDALAELFENVGDVPALKVA